MRKIIINQAGVDLSVRSFDNSTLQAIDKVLPLTSTVMVWGDEIYCNIDVDAPVQSLTADLAIGDVAYWPEDRCLCLFFGKTPLSVTEQPVPASKVIVIGHVDNLNLPALRSVGAGSTVRIC